MRQVTFVEWGLSILMIVEPAAFLGAVFVLLVEAITGHERLESMDLELGVSHEILLDFSDCILDLFVLPHDPLELLLERLFIHLLAILSAFEFL